MTYNEFLLELLSKLEQRPHIKDEPLSILGGTFGPIRVSNITADVIDGKAYILFA